MFRFSLWQLITLAALIPIGVGIAAECHLFGTYLDVVVFDEPFRGLQRQVMRWLSDSTSALSKVIFLAMIVAIKSLLGWLLTACCVVLYSFIRLTSSRIMAIILSFSFLVVELVFNFSLPGQNITLVIAQLICTTIAFFLLFALAIVIFKLRPTSNVSVSKNERFMHSPILYLLFLASFLISVVGWLNLQAFMKMQSEMLGRSCVPPARQSV